MNFDAFYDRHQSDSAKYAGQEGIIPLTVADTDFPTSKEVLEALKKRLEHPLFGYVKGDEGWKKALCDFYQRRFGLSLNPKEVAFSTGVLSAITAFLLAFTKPGNPVILCSPVYNCFYSCIEHTNRFVKDVPLLKDGSSFSLDYASLEEAFKNCKAMILCSPHNPVGKGFKKEELKKLFNLANRYGVLILSDEIHGLVSSPNKRYIPSLCLEEAHENVIMAASISKAFNTAGIQAAFVASKNPVLKERIENQLGYDDCGEPNAFAQPVLEAAYSKGDSYLDEFNAYIEENKRCVYVFFKDSPLKVYSNDFTYLLWIDCSSLTYDASSLAPYFKKEGVSLIPGEHYGETGKAYLRMNVALPRSVLLEALKRMEKALQKYLESK